MAGLLNAFSSGFVDGTRAGALMDATWAAQDERERAEKERQQEHDSMKGLAEYLAENPDGLSSPDGQQVAGRALMANPTVRKAVNSNSGHEYAGIIKNPNAEDEYYLAVRTPEGQIRPVTVGREKGGTPVAYTQQQLLNMSAASLADPATDTSEFRQKMGLPAEGDIYQAVAAKYPSMGTAEQVRAAALQGKEFIDKGGVPAAKTGVAGVKAAIRNPIEEEDEEEEVGEVEQMEPGKNIPVPSIGQSFSEANFDRAPNVEREPTDKELMRSPEGRKELARRAVSIMSGGAAQDDGTGLINQMVSNRNKRAEANEAERQALIAKQKEEGTYGARGVGKISRDLFNATKENVDTNVVQPLSKAASSVMAMAKGVYNTGAEVVEGFAGADEGAYQIKDEAPAPASTAPAPAQQATKPRDAAEIAVEKKRIPAKVFSNATHVEKIDKTLGQQVAKEPLTQRVSNDQESLDRLSKLATGRKPNSRALFDAMRLVKSGILTPDQLGRFRETGKLDNVEFENAYKEQSVRQGWTQLDIAKDRLTFDKYREQMDQQRHMQNQSLQRLKLFAQEVGKSAAAAEKQATKVYNGVHDVITADFMSRMNQMPEFKEASSGDVKFYAEAAATRLINNPRYVQSILGRDLADIGDAEHLRSGIKEIMPVIRGEGFWSKGSNIPLDTDFKKDPNKVLKGE